MELFHKMVLMMNLQVFLFLKVQVLWHLREHLLPCSVLTL